MELRSVTLSRWARGTLLGPMVTIWILITLAAGTESLDALADWVGLAGRFTDEWWLAMLLGSFWASTLAVALVAVDVALLRSKFRARPTGIRSMASIPPHPASSGSLGKAASASRPRPRPRRSRRG